MTTNLVTLDLFTILDDADQITVLHGLQRERQAENAITGGDRPRGMRLSIADPVRRVKAALDPFWAIPFDDGVAARGHALEAFLEVALFHGNYEPLAWVPYESQTPLVWHTHGTSAFDFVAHTNSADRVISCKTSINSTKPSTANLDQERRMMSLAGYPPGSVFEVWVINPGTFRAVGPYEYTLEQEHIDAARTEVEGVSAAFEYFANLDDPTTDPAWNDPAVWEQRFGLASTSGAFRYASLDASGAIEARNRAYLRARARAAEAKRDEDEAKQLIRTHVEEQLALARLDDPNTKTVVAYSGDELAAYTLDARGAMRVTVKPHTADAVA